MAQSAGVDGFSAWLAGWLRSIWRPLGFSLGWPPSRDQPLRLCSRISAVCLKAAEGASGGLRAYIGRNLRPSRRNKIPRPCRELGRIVPSSVGRQPSGGRWGRI